MDATRKLKRHVFARGFAYHAMSTTFVGADRVECICLTVGNVGLWAYWKITEQIKKIKLQIVMIFFY